MSPLYITLDPTEYLTFSRKGARDRITIKRTARERAEREGFDAIAIVDHRGVLIEQISTNADITAGLYIVGYRVLVKPTVPSMRADHPQNLDWAEMHGTVVVATDVSLTIYVPHADMLDKLKNDYRFAILNIEVVRA